MNENAVKYLKLGAGFVEECLHRCGRMQLLIRIFDPNRDLMDLLLTRDSLGITFNSDDPKCNILIFHDLKDEYVYNGVVTIVCHLALAPKVLKYVLNHKKVKELIKEMKQRKEVNK